MTQLTAKQENFCQYYLDTGNASVAYRMAYDCTNMKPETIWSTASRLLDNRKVVARLDEIRAERAAATADERKAVLDVLMDIVMADPSETTFEDPKTGKPKTKAPYQLPKRLRNAVKDMRNARGTVTYNFHGKVEAARQLAQMNGWNAAQKVEVGHNGGLMGELRIGFDDEEE